MIVWCAGATLTAQDGSTLGELSIMLIEVLLATSVPASL